MCQIAAQCSYNARQITFTTSSPSDFLFLQMFCDLTRNMDASLSSVMLKWVSQGCPSTVARDRVSWKSMWLSSPDTTCWLGQSTWLSCGLYITWGNLSSLYAKSIIVNYFLTPELKYPAWYMGYMTGKCFQPIWVQFHSHLVTWSFSSTQICPVCPQRPRVSNVLHNKALIISDNLFMSARDLDDMIIFDSWYFMWLPASHRWKYAAIMQVSRRWPERQIYRGSSQQKHMEIIVLPPVTEP